MQRVAYGVMHKWYNKMSLLTLTDRVDECDVCAGDQWASSSEDKGGHAALTYYVQKIQSRNFQPGRLDSDVTPLSLIQDNLATE